MAQEGITSGLIESFVEAIQNDSIIERLVEKINDGRATYADVERLASRTGTITGTLISDRLSELAVDGTVTEDQAREVLMALTESNHRLVSNAAAEVQESLNRRAGLGLKAIRPEFNRDRVEGLITEVVGKEDVAAFRNTLIQQVENVSMAAVDDSVKVNAKAHYNTGLSPKIVRVTDGKCCDWCSKLAGVYEYGEVNYTGSRVFRRHVNCGCQVLYDPGDGKKWQDVHSKRLLSREESDKIKVRQKARLTEERKTPEQREAEANGLLLQSRFVMRIDSIIYSYGSKKFDLQFFAERGLAKQTERELRAGIRSHRRNIEKHKAYIANPILHDPGFYDKHPDWQKGLLGHWRKEIENSEESIANRIEELQRRGAPYDEE